MKKGYLGMRVVTMRGKKGKLHHLKEIYLPRLKSDVAHLGVLGKLGVRQAVLAGATLFSHGEARRHVQGHMRGGKRDGSSWWDNDLDEGEFERREKVRDETHVFSALE